MNMGEGYREIRETLRDMNWERNKEMEKDRNGKQARKVEKK